MKGLLTVKSAALCAFALSLLQAARADTTIIDGPVPVDQTLGPTNPPLNGSDTLTIGPAGIVTVTSDFILGIYGTGNSNTITNSGSISTAGRSGWGITVAGGSNTITNSGSITTAGNYAVGIYANGGSNTIANNGSISTTGGEANGIFINGNSYIATNSGTITTSGYNADGFNAISDSNTFTNSGTITTSASLADGFRVYGNSNTFTNSGTITTSVSNAYGLRVSGDSNTITNSGSIVSGNGYAIDFDGSGNTLNILGGSIVGDINMGLGGVITLANGVTADLGGVISGTNGITFSGSGSASNIILSGINTYTGATTVTNGAKLSINGSIASSSGLTVNAGDTIGGSGSLPQTNLVAGATIAPGNSIGTVTVAGLSLNGGTIDAEIQGPQNDKVNVTGNVTNFTGTANLIPYGGGSPWPNFDYQLITASNSFVTSSRLTLDQSGITSALLNYGTNLVQEADGNATTFDVQWQPKNGSGATASAVSSLGKGQRNQLATAGAFDSVFSSLATAAGNQAGTTTGLNATGTAIGTTGFTTGQAAAAGISSDFLTATSQLLALTSGSQLTAAIDSLSPEPYAAYQGVGLSTLKRQRDLLFSQAGNCQGNGWIINAPETKKGKTPKRPVCVFAQANNVTSSIRGQDGLSSYNSGVFSSFYGLEYQPSKQWSVGAAYGYGTSNLSNMSLTSANVNSDVNSGAIYAVYKPAERWNIKALLGYSSFDVDGSRNVAYIGNGSTINGNTSANGYTAAINASYDIPIKVGKAKLPMLLKPIAGLAWGGYQQNGFTESDGGALNLRVNGNTANSLVGKLGLEFASSPIALSKNKLQSITPRLAVAYQVDALANSSGTKSLTSSFVDAPNAGSFSTQGENGGANAFTVAGGFDLQVAKNASLYATVSYEVESNGSQFGYGGGFRVSF